MLYFQDFGTLLYQFGDEEDTTIFQDISRYADVIDQVKDDISFLNYHTIQEGFRPDQVSIQLYDTPLYYWTFYLLNDDLREQGWPLVNGELQTYIKKIFPNITVTTRENISTKFKVGQTVNGGFSGVTGKIIRRNLDLGQIVIEGTKNFRQAGETISSTNSSGTVESVNIISSSAEHLAANYYTDTSGGIVDLGVDKTTGNLIDPGATKNEITNEQSYFNVNESLRQIKVIRPNLINTLVTGYKKAIRQ